MMNLKKLYLFAPPGSKNYGKATYIVSSNLVYSLALAHWLSIKFLPTEAY